MKGFALFAIFMLSKWFA